MNLLPFERPYQGKRVLITGNTGFSGSWLHIWLASLGASVIGLALPPRSSLSIFGAADLGSTMQHHDADIRDAALLRRLMVDAKPDFVFHLAAQALVRQSYHDPLETYDINVMGTANVLDACRHVSGLKAIVLITTDKVYRNNEWAWGYRETDALGGKDPYSASKAACEFVASSYRDSFFSKADPRVPLAVVRAGNIVGGGDWADDRIVADIVRAIVGKTTLTLRNPQATRPWQHVLSACHGYLLVGAGLIDQAEITEGAWNLGPEAAQTRPVADVIDAFATGWRKPEIAYQPSPLAEAGALMIDSQRARQILGWQPAWEFDEVFRRTADWYRRFYEEKQGARNLCQADIEGYRAVLTAKLS